MANSNRVFVSPGVYTSEKDLTFVAQSVGVTTLGLAGETLQGPAFEPILIKSFDEFKTYFGPTSPAKFGDGNPKYELGYVAKSYLQESNQLFVTRVLGLTGYKPGKTFGIKAYGGITVNLTTLTNTVSETLSGETNSIATTSYLNDLAGKIATDGQSVKDFVEGISVSNGKWFTLGYVNPNEYSALTSTSKVSGPIGSYTNKNWYNVYFKENGLNVIDGVYSYLFVYDGAAGGWKITQYEYAASVNEYAGTILATFRSRGSYNGQTLELEVEDNADVTLTGGSSLDPLAEFTLTVNGSTSGLKTFVCSLDPSSKKYITKVLGTSVFDKTRSDFPIHVHESYPNLTSHLFKLGLIRGIDIASLLYHNVANDFVSQWQTPVSPTVVSEVRGGAVSDLFDVVTISDGDAANTQVKLTIQNVDVETGEFDLIVRDFNDKDDNLIILEKFTRCTMNPDLPGYVARKIGTSDGEYELRSKRIMLSMALDHPTDAFPAGFKGFSSHSMSGSLLGGVHFKTQFYGAGDTIGYLSTGEPITTNGDKIRKVSLGLSDECGVDSSLFQWKGLSSVNTTKGFHLSSNAPVGYDKTPYDLEGTDKGLLDSKAYRKFTFAVCGGFDGWDVYRSTRTNGDGYIFGKNTYISNHTTNGGVFSSSIGNSDYYAYVKAFETFSNPESVDINIFATPGVDFYNHSSLVNQAIDMVENDRADSLYVIGSPNVDTVEEIIDNLDLVELDTNYSATYWPWIQVRDGDNATQLFIPPTGEVVKNIALTDNVSYPWFAVAGYSRGLVNAIKAKKKLTLDDRDELYKARINPIATFSDTGTIIWGNKTLQVRESALDRINVRRLLLRARKLISAVAVRLLFEQNDEQVRNEFLRLVNPILESIKKERGLYEFRVVVSNDPEDIDANTLRGKIYIKPTRSLEFIDVEFLITPTGASFENI